MNGIPTVYNGRTFRSKLEARWAAYFDLLQWEWEYEPFDGKGYLPDFVLLGNRPVLVAVKPDALIGDLEQYVDKVSDGVKGIWKHDILIVGCTPFMPGEYSDPIMGLLGEYWDYRDFEDIDDDSGWVWDAANWHTCGECKYLRFHHSVMSFAGRTCGHADGDHYLESPDRELLENGWRYVGEMTRWNPKR